METKVRFADAIQNKDKLFLNYNNLNEKLENSDNCSDFNKKY